MIEYRGATQGTSAAYALVQVFRMLRHATDDALRECGLTTPQWAALGCLAQSEWLSGADMARIHHVTPQTMNTILHNLQANGLIEREPHPAHGTVLRTHLTEAGREVLHAATRRVEEVQAQMLGELDAAQRATLLDLLGACMNGLRAAGVPDGVGCVLDQHGEEALDRAQ